MSSSATNFASLPLSTELYVTTKTRHARTVARSAIANTTVLKSRTLPLASFAVFVVTQVIWVVTVPIDREARIGATMLLAVGHRLVLAEKPTQTMR